MWIALWVCRTAAQGTLEFTLTLTGDQVGPPNNSPYRGSGSFTLTGDQLNYAVGMEPPYFLPTEAHVHGPAPPGVNGPPVFDLGNYIIFGPGPGTFGGLAYGGGRTLSASEIAGLTAGLWYVDFHSTDYPNGEIRGQIMTVPEPSTLALLSLGICFFRIWWRREKRRKNQLFFSSC